MSLRALRLGKIGAAVLLLASGTAAAATLPKPQRILSMNQCTDLLLLQLVPKSRIASISYVSREDVDELMPGSARGVRINRGSAEDIVEERPDLILAGDFTTPATRRFARQVGARIVEVKNVDDFDDLRLTLRQVGASVGEPERAEAMIRRIDAQLASLAASRPNRSRRIVAWSGGTTVPGKQTLANAIFEAAGAVNIAAQPGAAYSSLDVEGLLKLDPDLILYVGTQDTAPSAQGEQGRHPLVRRLYAGRRLAYSEAAASCGLPQSIDAAVALRRRMDALPPARKP